MHDKNFPYCKQLKAGCTLSLGMRSKLRYIVLIRYKESSVHWNVWEFGSLIPRLLSRESLGTRLGVQSL